MARRPRPPPFDAEPAAEALVTALRQCSAHEDESEMTRAMAAATMAELDPADIAGRDGADALCALLQTTEWRDASQEWQRIERTVIGRRWRRVRRLALRKL